MTGRGVMDSAQGAALRVQLDGLWNVLAPLEADARKVKDHTVLNLIKGVSRARDAAHAIEDRRPSDGDGVGLNKRT